jgi:hypothetical protein
LGKVSAKVVLGLYVPGGGAAVSGTAQKNRSSVVWKETFCAHPERAPILFLRNICNRFFSKSDVKGLYVPGLVIVLCDLGMGCVNNII